MTWVWSKLRAYMIYVKPGSDNWTLYARPPLKSHGLNLADSPGSDWVSFCLSYLAKNSIKPTTCWIGLGGDGWLIDQLGYVAEIVRCYRFIKQGLGRGLDDLETNPILTKIWKVRGYSRESHSSISWLIPTGYFVVRARARTHNKKSTLTSEVPI